MGKTYAMLRDGRAQHRAGVDAVVAYWERHGRAATAAQLGELEVLPTRTVSARGASFEDLDVSGALERRPQLALVDELAHANLPGERHAKRWQDVDELLAAGIDVDTTSTSPTSNPSAGSSRESPPRPAPSPFRTRSCAAERSGSSTWNRPRCATDSPRASFSRKRMPMWR